MSHRIEIERDNLWPTPIWRTKIEKFRIEERKVSFNEDMLRFIIDEVERDPKIVKKSNYGGWQSRTDLHKDPATKELCQEIYDICKSMWPFIKGIAFQQMWAAVNKKGNWNSIHQHGLYEISGAYYLQVPKNSRRICFRDPRPAAMGNWFVNKYIDKGELCWYTPEECDLMLWPSYLDHFVEPSESDKDRIMISFDIMLTQNLIF